MPRAPREKEKEVPRAFSFSPWCRFSFRLVRLRTVSFVSPLLVNFVPILVCRVCTSMLAIMDLKYFINEKRFG